MAIVLPFPVTRRRRQIEHAAAYAAASPPHQCEGAIADEVSRFESELKRKGVPLDLVEAERSAYDSAIRAALWRCVLLGDAR